MTVIQTGLLVKCAGGYMRDVVLANVCVIRELTPLRIAAAVLSVSLKVIKLSIRYQAYRRIHGQTFRLKTQLTSSQAIIEIHHQYQTKLSYSNCMIRYLSLKIKKNISKSYIFYIR